MAIGLLAIAINIARSWLSMFLQNETKWSDAVTRAAQSFSDAAKDVGDAVKPDR